MKEINKAKGVLPDYHWQFFPEFMIYFRSSWMFTFCPIVYMVYTFVKYTGTNQIQNELSFI